MKPFLHAKSSAKRFGGDSKDYIEIHNFMDWSKSALPDIRHRAVFHSAFGAFVVERVFGVTIKNSDGKEISTREIAEQHIMEDLGFIPTLEFWMKGMRIEDWMQGKAKVDTKFIPMETTTEVVPGEEFVDSGIEGYREAMARAQDEVILRNYKDVVFKEANTD